MEEVTCNSLVTCQQHVNELAADESQRALLDVEAEALHLTGVHEVFLLARADEVLVEPLKMGYMMGAAHHYYAQEETVAFELQRVLLDAAVEAIIVDEDDQCC